MLMSFSHSALLCVMMLAPKFQLRSYAATAVSRVLLCISTLDNFYFQKKWPKKLSLNLVGDGQFSFLAIFFIRSYAVGIVGARRDSGRFCVPPPARNGP